jgi:hypothetical protein
MTDDELERRNGKKRPWPIEVLFPHLREGTGPKFEPSASRIQGLNVTAKQSCSVPNTEDRNSMSGST